MKKILFSVGSLQIGGAETVMVDIINNIYKDFDITVLLIEKRGSLIESLNSNIKVKYLTKSSEYCDNKLSAYLNMIKLSLIYRFLSKKKWYVNRIYKKVLKDTYDTEIAFLAGVPSDIISRSPNKKSKKISWIHSCVDKYSYQKYLTLAKKFDVIVGVSKKSLDIFEQTYQDIKCKTILLNNYVDVTKIINKSNMNFDNIFSKNKINFLSLGRLSSEKGFDRIINVAKKYHKTINFYIGGIGNLETELKEQINKNNIKNVYLTGLLKNPYPYIKNADVFLLSSRSEAYPTVVIEAMILKKFIISTNCAGVEEILEKYENKIIINNSDDSLENGIYKYLEFKKYNNNNDDNSFIKQNEKNLELLKKVIGGDV